MEEENFRVRATKLNTWFILISMMISKDKAYARLALNKKSIYLYTEDLNEFLNVLGDMSKEWKLELSNYLVFLSVQKVCLHL